MFDRVAYGDAERKQKHLSNCIECDTEYDVAERPSVVQSAEYENKLGKSVCRDTKDWPDEVYDEQARGFGWREACERFEGGNGDKEGDTKDSEAGKSEKLSWGLEWV